jgi:HEAT repeat protein
VGEDRPVRRAAFALLVVAPAALCAACRESDGPSADLPVPKPTTTVAARHAGKTLEEWLPRLADKDAAARRDAAFAVGDFGSLAAEWVDALAPLLSDPDAGVRWSALVAVERIGTATPSVAEGVVAALSDAAPGVRSAARAAAKRGGAPVAERLLPVLLSDDWDRQEAASDLLGAIGPDALPFLRKALADERSDTAALAARAIGSVGPAAADAVADLVRGLGRSGSARREATDALVAIGAAARPALEAAAKDPDERVRSAAESALSRLPR